MLWDLFGIRNTFSHWFCSNSVGTEFSIHAFSFSLSLYISINEQSSPLSKVFYIRLKQNKIDNSKKKTFHIIMYFATELTVWTLCQTKLGSASDFTYLMSYSALFSLHISYFSICTQIRLPQDCWGLNWLQLQCIKCRCICYHRCAHLTISIRKCKF